VSEEIQMSEITNAFLNCEKNEIYLLDATRSMIIEQIKKVFSGSDLDLLIFLVNMMKKEVKNSVVTNQFGLEDETFEPIIIPISKIATIYNITGDYTLEDIVKATQNVHINIFDKQPYTKKTKKGEIRLKYSSRYIALFERIHYEIDFVTFNFNKYIFWLTTYRNISLI
jgi:hypothetical protein